MRVSSDDLRRTISLKSDEDLREMLYVRSHDYTMEALEVAKAEFAVRALHPPTDVHVAARLREIRAVEEKFLSWKLKLVSFFFSSFFFFIPAILAHRHFVEKGEKLKAKEWTNWALYGLAFYLAIGIVRAMLGSY